MGNPLNLPPTKRSTFPPKTPDTLSVQTERNGGFSPGPNFLDSPMSLVQIKLYSTVRDSFIYDVCVRFRIVIVGYFLQVHLLYKDCFEILL